MATQVAGLVGTEAPDFTLPDAYKNPVSLADFRGRKAVLLVFYPFAFSGNCTAEFCQVRDELPEYQNGAVQILGISTDAPAPLKAWSEAQGFQFPLLSDFWPHGAVAMRYGVFFEKAGTAMRGTFLVDVDGVIRFAEVFGLGERRDQNAWKRAMAELHAAPA